MRAEPEKIPAARGPDRMHEYSLVQAMFEQIETTARAHGAVAVHRVKVRIGELAGVDASLLKTAYEMYRERTICAAAPIDVEEVAVRWSCPDGHADIARGSPLVCPLCGRPARLTAGDEMVLEQLELEVP